MKSKIKNPNELVWLIVALLVVLFLFNSSTQQDDVIVGAFEDPFTQQDERVPNKTKELDQKVTDIFDELKEEIKKCKEGKGGTLERCNELIKELENRLKDIKQKEEMGGVVQEERRKLEPPRVVADKDKSKDNLLNHFRGNTDVRYLYFNNHWIKWAKNGWVIKDRKGNIIKTVPGAKRLDFYYTIINLDKMPKSRLPYRDFINKKGRSTVLKIQVEGVTGYVYWNKNSKKYTTLSDTPSGGLKAIEGWIITHNDKVVKSEANAAAAELKEERNKTDRPGAGRIIPNPLISPRK